VKEIEERIRELKHELERTQQIRRHEATRFEWDTDVIGEIPLSGKNFLRAQWTRKATVWRTDVGKPRSTKEPRLEFREWYLCHKEGRKKPGRQSLMINVSWMPTVVPWVLQMIEIGKQKAAEYLAEQAKKKEESPPVEPSTAQITEVKTCQAKTPASADAADSH